MEKVEVLIVGAGLAGLTAAIWCKRLGLHAVVVEREREIGGQLQHIKNEIWDYPPYVYENGLALLSALKENEQVGRLDCRLGETLLSIDDNKRRIHTDKRTYEAEYVILCTGVRPNSLPALHRSNMVLAPWFSTTSQGEVLREKNVLIIGGGDRAMESGYNLAAYARHIFIAVRRNRLRARPEWVRRLSACENVTIMLNTELARTSEHEPKGVFLRTAGAPSERFLAVDWILPRIGVRGNSEAVPFLKTYGQQFVEVDSFQVTSTDWIYAVGDLTNGAAYASLALAAGQAMKAVKHISLRKKEGETNVHL